MAIYTPAGGGLPRAGASNATLSVGAQGQPILFTATTNRKGQKSGTVRGTSSVAIGPAGGSGPPSAGFQQLDSFIYQTDASFDLLPP